MEKEIKIIATIGPQSNKDEILEKLENRGVNFFRINLSHTKEEEIEEKVKILKKHNTPIILDTEGCQVRSGNASEIEMKEGDDIRIHKKEVESDSKNLTLNPLDTIENLQEGDLISIDFNSLLLKVYDISELEEKDYIKCKVLIGGSVGSSKAVTIDSPTFILPAFSKKDLAAIEIGKKYGIKHFTLSFMESPDSVRGFRGLYPGATLYSKIESRKGLDNFLEIAKESDGILIDRGDLSSQVPIERIPLIQKYIIKKCRELNKEVFVATNTLEAMASALKPNRAEVNDIVNTALDGVTGFALTKETAVGKYPVETVNMMINIINQLKHLNLEEGGDLIESIEKSDYIKSESLPNLLTEPNGGVLVNRCNYNYNDILPKKTITINEENLMDIEQIAVGAFSPLQGFLTQAEFRSVVDNLKMPNGTVWPLPINLSISEEEKNNLKVGEEVSLAYNKDNIVYATLKIEDIYKVNKEEEAKKIYDTTLVSHPGVKKFLEEKEYFIGGKITLIKRRNSEYKFYELTPKQTRKIFSERGWSKIVGFHTRNIIHKSHEFIQLEGMRKGFCDGLFIHPVIGKKKTGDFNADTIVKSYEKMIDTHYPKSKVMLSFFPTYSRYCGPREAIFTAITRQNFGCSHFIVGRDHTGVGDFYKPDASHNIFDNFTKDELKIIPIKFNKVFYSLEEEKYLHEPDHPDHPEEGKLHISGTQARDMLKQKEQPPEWFMRKEISELIIDRLNQGKNVFVE